MLVPAPCCQVGVVAVPLSLFYISNATSSLMRFCVCKKPEYVIVTEMFWVMLCVMSVD